MRSTLALSALALVACSQLPTLPIFREERMYRHTLDECIPFPLGGLLCHVDLILDETGGATLWSDDIPHCGRYVMARDTMTVIIGESTEWRFALKDDGERMVRVDHGTVWHRIETEMRSSCRLDERATY